MMDFIRRFFDALRNLVGLEDDIEAIAKPLQRIVDRYNRLADHQVAKAETAEETAARLRIEAETNYERLQAEAEDRRATAAAATQRATMVAAANGLAG